MDKYKSIQDFPNSSGAMSLVDPVVTAIPPFFPFLLFIIWIFAAGASYFIVLKTTAKRRFWHCLLGSSFGFFLISLVIAMQNSTSIIYLDGYWVGFYILMVMGSYFMVTNYK